MRYRIIYTNVVNNNMSSSYLGPVPAVVLAGSVGVNIYITLFVSVVLEKGTHGTVVFL